jgi:diacylglycerol O-acyltransferase
MMRMTGTDAAFLEMETSTMHLHVVGVLVLDPSTAPQGISLDRVTDLFAARIHLIAPFRRRAVAAPAGLDHPHWIEDPEFDLSRHLHHRSLGPTADASDLEAFVGELASSPLERDRPLWETWLVDGFADGTVALVTKVHHAIMDGASGGDMMASLFDLEPVVEEVDAPPPWQGEPLPGPARLVAVASSGAMWRAISLPSVVARTAAGLARSARAMADQPTSPVQFAPDSPFNGPLTAARSVAFTRCALDDLKEVRRAFGTTINDVVLAAATASLREYLLERDIRPAAPLVASVPVALARGPADPGFGNRVSNMMVSLPVDRYDPIDALRTIHAEALGAKAVQQAMGPDIIEDWMGVAPAALLTAGAQAYSTFGLGRFHPPLFNAIVSNVAGPPIPLYLAGARVLATYPMGPLIGNTALNLTVLSETGDLDVGVIACPDLVDDVGAIADGFVAGVASLLEAARATRSR